MDKSMKNKGRSGAEKMAPKITISIQMMPTKLSESEKRVRLIMKGVKHYKKDGTLWTGNTHMMPNGALHTGKTHGKTSVKLFHRKDLSAKVKKKL